MYIWPFFRSVDDTAIAFVSASASSPTFIQAARIGPLPTPPIPSKIKQEYSHWDSKMQAEQEKLEASQSLSFRTRRLGGPRRMAAGFIFAIFTLWILQPFARLIPASTGTSTSVPLPGHRIAPTATKSSGKELVPLEAHIMSKCPDAQDCLVDLIVPAMQQVSDKVNFTLSFIGDVDNDETVHCKHGEDECLGNIMMLCAEKLYPDPKISLGFSTCLIRDYARIPDRHLAEGCALEHAVDFDKLNTCMSEEGEGLEMLKASIRRSAAKKVQYSCTVRLNNKLRCIRDNGEWVNCDDGSEPGDLIRDIKSLYT